MKSRTLRRLYWIVTIIFCLANLFSGIAELFPPNQQTIELMEFLGYPLYFLTFLGVGKILGSIAVIQTKFRTIKEWAYAGFTIDYLSASASFLAVGGGVLAVLFPFIFLAVMFASYYLWKISPS